MLQMLWCSTSCSKLYGKSCRGKDMDQHIRRLRSTLLLGMALLRQETQHCEVKFKGNVERAARLGATQ